MTDPLDELHIASTEEAERDTERLRKRVIQLADKAVDRLLEDLSPTASISARNAALAKVVPHLFKNIESRDAESAAMKKMKADWNDLVGLMAEAGDGPTIVTAPDTSMVDAPALPDIAHPE